MKNVFTGLKLGLGNLIARGVLRALDSHAKCQRASLTLMAGEVTEGLEYLEPYGLTSTAHPGAESVVLFLEADRSHGVVINVADRRYRLQGLEQGEVALYSDEGDSLMLRRGNRVELSTKTFIVNAQERVTFNTPLLEVPQGEIRDKTSTISSLRQTYNGHMHKENGDGGGTTDKPAAQMGAA